MSSPPGYAKKIRDIFTAPELAKDYIPKLMERGGFSVAIDCQGVIETIISLPGQTGDSDSGNT